MMKAYLLLSLMALLLTGATSAAIEALTETGIAILPEKTSGTANLHLRVPTSTAVGADVSTETGASPAPQKTSEAASSHPIASSTAEAVQAGKPFTKTGTTSPAQKTHRALSRSATHRPKCTNCCVFRLREHQWIPPDTTVVVLPETAACVPVPVEGQYNLVTTHCSAWFGMCTMWPQHDCTGEHRLPFDVHDDLGTWWGATYWIRAVSCTRNESFVP
jgi:hypothetical protein